jgi:hypothetical protein
MMIPTTEIGKGVIRTVIFFALPIAHSPSLLQPSTPDEHRWKTPQPSVLAIEAGKAHYRSVDKGKHADEWEYFKKKNAKGRPTCTT